jgi:predicted transcriptional regulator
MLNGAKTVELRRRPIRVPVGTTVWIYVTVPTGRVGAMAKVLAIEENTPSELWRRYQDRVGISQGAFFSYFKDSRQGCAVVFQRILPLQTPLGLTALRKSLGTFVPPQFYRKLELNSPELALFKRSAPGID